MAMKRPGASSGTGVPAGPSLDAGFMERYPLLSEHLCEAAWDDGTPREGSTVLFLVDQGTLKVCLNDRALERSAWVSGASVSELLDALEEGLMEDALDWRTKSYVKQRGRR